LARQANAQPDIKRDREEFWRTEANARVSWYEPFGDLLEWKRPTPSGSSAAS
jgi:hypothetical protein